MTAKLSPHLEHVGWLRFIIWRILNYLGTADNSVIRSIRRSTGRGLQGGRVSPPPPHVGGVATDEWKAAPSVHILKNKSRQFRNIILVVFRKVMYDKERGTYCTCFILFSCKINLVWEISLHVNDMKQWSDPEGAPCHTKKRDQSPKSVDLRRLLGQ